MKLHCPICGTLLTDFTITYEDRISTGYGAYCKTCDKTVSIEDRSSYEQEGVVDIVLK